MSLIADRAKQDSKLPSVYCFNTFFCSTLREHGYQRVKRWTKRVDIFAKDLLFIPINYSYHWTLGVVDMKQKTITVYDSLGGGHRQALEVKYCIVASREIAYMLLALAQVPITRT